MPRSSVTDASIYACKRCAIPAIIHSLLHRRVREMSLVGVVFLCLRSHIAVVSSLVRSVNIGVKCLEHGLRWPSSQYNVVWRYGRLVCAGRTRAGIRSNVCCSWSEPRSAAPNFVQVVVSGKIFIVPASSPVCRFDRLNQGCEARVRYQEDPSLCDV